MLCLCKQAGSSTPVDLDGPITAVENQRVVIQSPEDFAGQSITYACNSSQRFTVQNILNVYSLYMYMYKCMLTFSITIHS